jgi:hypothetical protein
MANNANYLALQDHLQAARAETASLRAELQTAQQSMANFTQANQVITAPTFARPPAHTFTPVAPQYTPPVMNTSSYGQDFGYGNHGYSRRTRGV